LAKILCPCTSCQPFLEVQRVWFLEMQDKFISRKGSQILTNGGKIIAANHIMHSGPKQEVPMSDSWNNKLGFRAKLITVKSDNFLCLLYATDCILSTTGNNLWSVPELEKMLNCYCIDNFGLLLKQSMEDQDFKDTGIERLTRGGKVICRDIQDYISLIKNTPFYRERFEILALSQILGATIKVWLSPDNVECFNNGQADILNLYLDMDTNHFSPIIHMAPKNGNYFPGGKSSQAHEFRLARHMEPKRSFINK
jgi:hypothetical protein